MYCAASTDQMHGPSSGCSFACSFYRRPISRRNCRLGCRRRAKLDGMGHELLVPAPSPGKGCLALALGRQVLVNPRTISSERESKARTYEKIAARSVVVCSFEYSTGSKLAGG